jgi:hypothetical protein
MPLTRPTLSILLLLGACAPGDVAEKPDAADTSTAPDSDASEEVAWPAPGESACGNPASRIQIAVTVPNAPAATGDIVVALLHRRMGSPEDGGHPHYLWTFEDQPLDATVPTVVEVDMCDGNAIMWSEENCEYNLVVLVDGDGDNGLRGARRAVPDTGEPTSVQVFEQSCHHDGSYRFELSLDCVDGEACVAYEAAPECACAEPACDSEAAICSM